jgi:L-Ala-D/L-Glu epimerase
VRVAALEAIPYALPFQEPYVTARGRLERREMVLVRLRTHTGEEGLGDAVPMSLRGDAPLRAVAAELRELGGDALVGRKVEDIEVGSGTFAYLSAPARAAIESAVLDLRGKVDGVPVWRLLGGASGDPVPCNATLVAGPPAAVAGDAERWARCGFETFKLKVGVPGDVGQVEAVRVAVGNHARLRVDANGAWNPQEAILRLTAMERHGIELAEQPAADLEDLAAVRNQTAIPIAADESIASVEDARRATELGACQLATVKLAKVGGFASARAIAAELPVYLSSALDGPVGIAAAAHAAMALREVEPRAATLAQGIATQLLFADTVASVECEVRDGLLHVPGGPGLGVEIDDRALDRHRL